MRRVFLALASSAWLVMTALAAEGIRLLPGLGIERLPARLAPSGGKWEGEIDFVGCGQHLWLTTAGQVWRLDRNEPILATPLPITSLACTEAGTLLIAAQERLGPISGRLFIPALSLPSRQTRLAAGPGDTLVLYETSVPARLFHFDGERVRLVATLAEPIMTVVAVGDSYFVATPSGIYRLRSGEPIGLIFPWLGEEKPIIALAVHPRTAELVVATEDEVFLLDEGKMEQIAYGLGGKLVVNEESIYVADAKRGNVYRLFRKRSGAVSTAPTAIHRAASH